MKVVKKIRTVAMYIAVATLSVGTFSSCNNDDDPVNPTEIVGEGDVVTQTLSVANFTGIDLASLPNVTVKQGATQEVKATGHSNIIEKIKTDVNNNVWKIDLQEGTYNNINLSIEITVPNINTVIASGSGNIVVEDFENQNALTLAVSSTGNITLNKFEGITELSPVISSAGNITANEDISTLQTLNITASSNGNYNGFALSADNCTVTASSNGKVELTANTTLNVTISGNGNVYYKGSPSITQNVTGNGQLIDAN